MIGSFSMSRLSMLGRHKPKPVCSRNLRIRTDVKSARRVPASDLSHLGWGHGLRTPIDIV